MAPAERIAFARHAGLGEAVIMYARFPAVEDTPAVGLWADIRGHLRSAPGAAGSVDLLGHEVEALSISDRADESFGIGAGSWPSR